MIASVRLALRSGPFTLLENAVSLAGSTLTTSLLGYFYWSLATRLYPPDAVGLSAASVSAMSLLGMMAVFGLGTLLIRELPRQPGFERSLITTAVAISAIIGGVLGLIFAIVAPSFAADFLPLRASVSTVTLFVAGVSLTAASFVVDQALLGLLRGRVQLARNIVFAVTKLAAMAGISFLVPRDSITILGTWVAGSALSLGVLPLGALLRTGSFAPYRPGRPSWLVIRAMGPAALSHHGLNLTLQLPGLTLPILVTASISAASAAYFYMAWMIAGLIFMIPIALTTSLYAVAARYPLTIAQRMRLTISLSLVGTVTCNLVLLVAGGPLLSLFGPDYAEYGKDALSVIALSAVLATVKDHYVTVCRLNGKILQAFILLSSVGIAQLLFAAIGSALGGLFGLSIGWLLGSILETALTLPLTLRTAYTC